MNTKEQFIESIREYIVSVRWQKTSLPKYKDIPHEYTASIWNSNRIEWFEALVVGIRKYGYKEKFGKTTYTYLDIDGRKYWTLGMPLYMTHVINRVDIKNDKELLV